MIENGRAFKASESGSMITLTDDSTGARIGVAHNNRISGVTGSSSVFSTAPTTLANCTDGDYSTVTGAGQLNLLAAGDYGIITWDMGTTYTVLVGGRVGVWAASSRSIWVFIEGSDDNITWRGRTGGIATVNCSGYVSVSPGTEEIADLQTVILNCRYIRLRFYANGAANTAQAKIYEVFALDMGGI